MAFHTKTLLQDLELVHPMSFRLLTGGPLAMQLGLSKKERHIDLLALVFGQFQLSKVPPPQNLAKITDLQPFRLLAYIGCSHSLRCIQDLQRC